MKIIADENIPYLRGRLEGQADIRYVDQFGFTPELVRDADALLIRTRTQCNESLLKGSKVRLVATATIGTDQIDIPWCEANGITVKSSPGCNAPGVAQYVWSALLRLGFRPKEGMTLGIVGCGHIGSIVKAWGEALGANILVSDPPKARRGEIAGSVPLEELLSKSDAVTLHTPLTRSAEDPTFHLIGERELAILGDNKILVNASRGPVVDNAALSARLDRGGLRTAIDVWEGEPQLDEDLLQKVDYGTFHIAGYSRQGKERATRMILEALETTFGISVDKSGLEPPYSPLKANQITEKGIISSYDINIDSEALKANPKAFDTLRHDYHYREEKI